jgi:hypothetical protein
VGRLAGVGRAFGQGLQIFRLEGFEFGGGGCAVWWTVDASGSQGRATGCVQYRTTCGYTVFVNYKAIGDVEKPFTWLGAKRQLAAAYEQLI